MKALIAMSGGVDSSVAALLTKQSGYDCIGCTMKLYENPDDTAKIGKTCCSLDDVEDARSVAYKLQIPYYVFNFKNEFKEKVINKFVNFYERGLTPNPCLDCNRYLKFGKLLQRAKELGCDFIVTGHYAIIEFDGQYYRLKKAKELSKDQSYVLYGLTQNELAHTLFPLGNFTKDETRKLAAANGFVNAQKHESQDICFVPDGDYAKVIATESHKTYPCGDFVDKTGKVLGQHKGLINYTIGQRKGLGISAKTPLYVCKICPHNNTVILGDNADLFQKSFKVKDFNWLIGTPPAPTFKCKAKIRYNQKEQPATVTVITNTEVVVEFDEPQRAISPGQAAVLYDGDVVLGGGEIVG